MDTLLLEKELNLQCVTNNNTKKDVKGCYISDLLSLAMGRVGDDYVWITVQSNINIIAIASLTEAACIILPESVKIDNEIINKAVLENVIVFSSTLTAYELAVRLGKLI